MTTIHIVIKDSLGARSALCGMGDPHYWPEDGSHKYVDPRDHAEADCEACKAEWERRHGR